MEQWEVLREFPTYAISNHGRVRNEETGRILSLYRNQRGIVYVGMMSDHEQLKRSVDLLVAETFLDSPELSSFSSVIHLDANFNNNRADNLMWRPLWFRVAYHNQFAKRDLPRVLVPVYVVDTDEVFPSSREVAMKYGLLEKEIAMSCNNYTDVWPVNYQMRLHRE